MADAPTQLLLISIVVLTGSCYDCPYLSLPSGTNRTSDEIAEFTTITYTCTNNGHAFKDQQSTTLVTQCQPDGTWNPMPHPCKARRCGTIPLINYAITADSSTLPGAEVTFKCRYGYVFPDNSPEKTIYCDSASLQWLVSDGSSLSSVVCNSLYCPNRPTSYSTMTYEGLDSYVDDVGLPAGSYVNGYCSLGYYKNSPSVFVAEAKCNIFGVYEPTSFGECTKRTCRSYQTENAVLLKDENGYLEQGGYRCTQGRFPGGNTDWQMICDANGQWKSEPPLSGCQGGGCESGWIEYNDYCYYFSDPATMGLRYDGAERSCIAKNAHLVTVTNWNENHFIYKNSVERNDRDYWIGYHRDPDTGVWGWFDDQVSSFTRWYFGYPELYDCARISVYGVWKDKDCVDIHLYVCKKPAMCPPPPTIENGGPVLDEVPALMDVGQTLLYRCNPGYAFRSDSSTEKNITCLEGAYYTHIENCQESMCPPITKIGFSVKNAVISGNQENKYNYQITWNCKRGFMFPDGALSKTMVCQQDRTWSEIPPNCIKLRCPSDGTLNSKALYYSTDYGISDYFKCDEGYELPDGREEISKNCQEDATWFPEGDCWKKECQKYIQYNTTIEPEQPDEIKFGFEVEVTCIKGREFPDGERTKTTKCGPDYHWVPYLLPCQCGTPPQVPNAEPNTTEGTIGTYVAYTCKSGYAYIDGDTERVAYCDIDTTRWVNVPTECLSELPNDNNFVKAGKVASTAIAAVSITLLVLLLLVIMCKDCAEDRKVIPVCCNNDRDENESENDTSEEDSSDEEDKPEPIRFTMAP